jgi:type IV pilus assembly protein PilA
MFLQNLRAKVGARLNGDSEAGFTLIELLVVMLILGILAAIALPAFFNQKEKAGDAKAKETAHSVQVALETYATDNGGTYVGATLEKLNKIEPTIDKSGTSPITLGGLAVNGYTITVKAQTGNEFSIKNTAGSFEFTCVTAGNGGCPTGGDWSK